MRTAWDHVLTVIWGLAFALIALQIPLVHDAATLYLRALWFAFWAS